MRAIVITRHGGPEVLQIQERPDPTPRAGEVQIRVRASGINFADLMARMGLYPEAPKPPSVVGYEVAGEVSALGAGVGNVKVGDRVLAPTMFGGYAEKVVVPAMSAFKMPEGMDFAEAAAIPVNYMTAYHMLHHVGSLKAGEFVLIQAAAGGVGLAVIDLALAAGAIPIGLASESKHEFLRERGAECLISRDEDLFEAVKKYTDKRGVDLVLDSEGGPGLQDSYNMLRSGGRLISFGASSLAMGNRRDMFGALSRLLRTPKFKPLTLMKENRGVIGVNMNTLSQRAPDIVAREMQSLLAMHAAGQIRPHVDKQFAPEEAGAAHQYLHDRKNKGKVVIAW